MNGVNSPLQATRPDIPQRPRSSLLPNGIVLLSMLLVALASGVAVHVHAGIEEFLALIFAAGVLCVLLSAHLLIMGPSSAASRARQAPKTRMPPPSPETSALPARTEPGISVTPAARATQNPAAMPPPISSARPGTAAHGAAHRPDAGDLPEDFPDKLAQALGVTNALPDETDDCPLPEFTPIPAAGSNSKPSGETAADQRMRLTELSRNRPARLREPPLPMPPAPVKAPAAAKPAAVTRPEAAPVPPPAPAQVRAPAHRLPPAAAEPALDNDAQAAPQNIEGILKRMAAQIRAGSEPTEEAGPATEVAAGEQSPAGAIPVSGAPQGDPRKAISAAVNALKAAADDMRSKVKGPESASNPPIHARLAEVAEAISKDQLDIYLNPIMGLGDGRPRHFEVSILARTADGDGFDPKEFRALTRGSGLMPLLDSSHLRHSSAVAERLAARVKNAAVFSTVEAETLDNRRFFATVDRDQSTGLLQPERLVLSLRQADVRTFVPAHFESLKLLRDMGFRFALQDVTDLDMSFDELAVVGFEFAKLDAEVFLNGMRVGTESLPATEICSHLQANGIKVIIRAISTEDQRAAIAASGVVLGQGELFGAPTPIRRAAVGQGSGVAA